MTKYISILILIAGIVLTANAFDWPIPYQKLPYRPANDPYCQAGLIPFCPDGKEANQFPEMEENDVIEVYALKKPVWSFKFGPTLGYFHIMHDALGFKNVRTGLNYTMEWYELDQLFNCTFPHLLNDTSEKIKWCNQGALCVYNGINDTVWTEYGTLVKVSEISGDLFNKFANWSTDDNNTAIFYETWTVYNTDNIEDPRLTMYFDSFDCASWVLRAMDAMYALGAKYDERVSLNYTRLNLYSYEPQLLGNYSDIFDRGNATLVNDILDFFSEFQKSPDVLDQLFTIYSQIAVKQKFYFYYNQQYWYLKLKSPFIKVTYNRIPLPGTKKSNKKLRIN